MTNWKDICSVDDILPNSGRCALHQGEQVAVFRVRKDDGEKFYAVGNYDPFGDANVISRGIVGNLGDSIVVASPLYKQHFCLDSGRCLEDETVTLKTWPIRVQDDRVQLAA